MDISVSVTARNDDIWYVDSERDLLERGWGGQKQLFKSEFLDRISINYHYYNTIYR